MYYGCILLASLIPTAHAIMVQMADGSFVPWSLERRASGGLPLRLTNHNDSSYLTTVLMGTPFQNIDMAPSLSQNFVAVASVPYGLSGSAYYNPTSSSSYMPENGIATLQGISGDTLSGSFASETCMLNATNLQTWGYNASIVLTNGSVSDDLYPVGARGVLGYGLNAPATPANDSLIPTFLPANFTTAVCGIELNHVDDPVPDGTFTMGAVDPTAYTGDFSNVPVPADSQISWSVPFDSLTYVSSGVNQTVAGLLASVDLYHSVIQLPSALASQIYGNITGSQALSDIAWSLPCSSTFQITLVFNGTPFTITERDTIMKLPNGTCQGAVTGGALDVGKVGAPFMRNVYTQFGATKASDGSTSFFVGFATKIVRSAPVTTTLISPTTVTATAPKSTATGGDSVIAFQSAILFSTFAITSIVALFL